jgi:hypothetical protein
MSIAVALADLPATTATYRWAYLLTVRDDSSPHVVAVMPAWDDDGETLIADVGSRTAANARARPAVTLCYPPIHEAGYSLVVDGIADVDVDVDVDADRSLRLRPTGAVLHRPAPER